MDAILYYDDADCKNVVYSNGQLVCADTGEVLADHPIALDVYHNITRQNADALYHLVRLRDKLVEAVMLYLAGAPIKEILRRTGIASRSLLYSVIKASGGVRKRHRPHRRIDAKIIEEVCRYRAEGRPLSWIARELDRSFSTIRRIVREHCREQEPRSDTDVLMKVVRGEISTWDAAKILNVSPSTLYKRIKKLRQRLGSNT